MSKIMVLPFENGNHFVVKQERETYVKKITKEPDGLTKVGIQTK